MKKLTKHALAMSFMQMCGEVPLKDISVKDFILYAGISKQTFYNYFRDKDDLMNYVYSIAADNIILNMTSSVRGVYYSAYDMARVCMDNKNFYIQLASYETQNDFQSHFLNKCENVYADMLAKNSGHPVTDARMKKIIHVFCTGVCVFFTEWLQGGLKDPPEFVAQIIVDCMPADIRKGLETADAQKTPENAV